MAAIPNVHYSNNVGVKVGVWLGWDGLELGLGIAWD